MLKAAIVGCGKIADAHASQIQRIKGATIVAACDREPLMAGQLAERFGIERQFVDVEEMLRSARPDVVHIATPPTSHFQIARLCLERGCHVYVEKPITLDAAETHALLTLADRKQLKLTAGHDDQFSHVARRMRRLVESGYLGGAPVHMESYYSYDLTEPGYARAVLSDKQHWVRRLPGQLLHNIISHGIARIAEFLTSETPVVIAHGFSSPRLQQLGESEMIDELRVIISEEALTAYFTFSSQMRPSLHQFRLYGPNNGLVLDQDHETLIRLPGTRFKSYAEKFVPPALLAKQYLNNVITNGKTFWARDFHMKSGMKHLIELLYRSIVEHTPPPIPYDQILRTATIMDAIFTQLDAARTGARFEPAGHRLVRMPRVAR